MFARSATAAVDRLGQIREKVDRKRKQDEEVLQRSKQRRLDEIHNGSGSGSGRGSGSGHSMDTSADSETKEPVPSSPMIAPLISVQDSKSVCQLLRTVMKWSQYFLRHPDQIDQKRRVEANSILTHLRGIYFRERTRLGWFESLTGRKSLAILWFIAMSQLNIVKCRHTVDVNCATKTAQDFKEVIERDLGIYSDPILKYTLIQCGMMLDLLIEDMGMREPSPDMVMFYELVELRLHQLISFTWSEDIMNDPRYAHIIPQHQAESFGMLNTLFMRDMEMATYYMRIPEIIRTSWMKHAPPIPLNEAELKRVEPVVTGIKRWITNMATTIQSDKLRRDYREGMFERMLYLHEREMYEAENNIGKHIIVEASTVVRLKRPDANQSLGITVMQPWLELIDHHVDVLAPAYTELVFQFFHFAFQQRYQGYNFMRAHVIRWTDLATLSSKVLLAPTQDSQRPKWEKDTNYPFIFDYRKQPIVYMRAGKKTRLCPNALSAFAWWFLCLMDNNKGLLTNQMSVARWFEELSSPKDELAEVKRGVEFLPICALPARFMKAAAQEHDRFHADRLASEKKASEAARAARLAELKKRNDEIKARKDAVDQKHRQAAERLKKLEQEKEEVMLRELRASIDARRAAEGKSVLDTEGDFSKAASVFGSSLGEYQVEAPQSAVQRLKLRTDLFYDDAFMGPTRIIPVLSDAMETDSATTTTTTKEDTDRSSIKQRHQVIERGATFAALADEQTGYSMSV